jgi:hypothetical protein
VPVRFRTMLVQDCNDTDDVYPDSKVNAVRKCLKKRSPQGIFDVRKRKWVPRNPAPRGLIIRSKAVCHLYVVECVPPVGCFEIYVRIRCEDDAINHKDTSEDLAFF